MFGLSPDEEISNDNIRKIITDQEDRRKLAARYRLRFGEKGLNATSLVTFHGPTGTCHLKRRLIVRSILCSTQRRCLLYCQNGRIGYFLTGDAEFQGRWNEIEQHFRLELPRMSGVLLPHHGSNENGADVLISNMKSRPVYYLSAGIENKHGHPYPDVVKNVVYNGRCIFWSNQFNKVEENFS